MTQRSAQWPERSPALQSVLRLTTTSNATRYSSNTPNATEASSIRRKTIGVHSAHVSKVAATPSSDPRDPHQQEINMTSRHRFLIPLAVALICGASAGSAVAAGGHDRSRALTEVRSGLVIDSRHGHDRYYPAVGSS